MDGNPREVKSELLSSTSHQEVSAEPELSSTTSQQELSIPPSQPEKSNLLMQPSASSHQEVSERSEPIREEPNSMDTDDIDFDIDRPSANTEDIVSNELNETGSGDQHNLLDIVKHLETEKANTERNVNNILTELEELRTKNTFLTEKNEWLEEQLNVQSRECIDRQRMFQKLEDSRNEIAERVLKLETQLNKVRSEKDERDSKISSLVRDKQVLMTENVGLQEELKRLSQEKTKISLQLEGLRQETSTTAIEKQWRKLDQQLADESRKWFLNEVSERDAKVTQITLEIRAKELKWKNHELDLTRLLKKAEADVIALEEKLSVKEEALARVTANIEHQADKNRLEIKNLIADLAVKGELAENYKRGLEQAEKMAEELAEQFNARNELLRQSRDIMEEVRMEREQEREELQRQIDNRDSELIELREEVGKLNELLKSKHAVSLNVTEEELASLSPAAAETSRLMKSGSSLTSLVRDHARLAGELASEKERSKQLEDALQEIVRDVEDNIPQFNTQREQLNQAVDENSRLMEQLQRAEESRLMVEANRDQALRELAFTKAELENYQRECSSTNKKLQRLLFVIECQSRDPDGPPITHAEEQHLFDNIAALQKVNLQLESELSIERDSAANRNVVAQSNELLVLRKELEASRETENHLNYQLEQINVAFESIREQNQKLVELHKDDTAAEQLRDLKLQYYELSSDLEARKMSIARLENTVNHLQQEKETLTRIYETRLTNSTKLVDELKSINAKLEAKFEYQNQIAETNAKELELIQKEMQRIEKENKELRRTDDTNAEKITRLNDEIIRINEEIQCNVNTDELMRIRSDNARLIAQLEVYQNRLQTDQYLHNSIMDINSRMQRVQAERDVRVETQLEVLQVERDALKRDLTKTSEQLMHSREETKNIQSRLDNEVSLLAQKLVEKEEHIRTAETALFELKTKLQKLQSTSSNKETEEMSPERLRKECQQLTNRVKFLESQLEDAKAQLDAATTEVERFRNESQKMETHSGRLESGLKDVQETATLEKQRLIARSEAAESRANALVDELAKFRNLLEEKTTELENFKFEAVQKEGDLNIKIEVQQQQLADATNRNTGLTEKMNNIIREQSSKDEVLESMKTNYSEVETRAEEATMKIEQLNTRLMAQQNEILTIQESLRMAEENRKAAVNALELRSQQADKAEATWRESLAEQDQKLKELLFNYEQLVEKMGSATDTALKDIGMEGIVNPELPQAVLESQKIVIDYLRQEKENAVLRSMNAEIELKRLRSDVEVHMNNRTELVNKIHNLEVAARTADQLLVEKAELLKKLEQLSVTQQQYQRARQDKENLQKLLADTQRQQKTNEETSNALKSQIEELNIKATAISAEKEKKDKEIEVLKQQLQRQTVRAQSQGSLVQSQKLQTEVAQKQAELEKALQQITELEKSVDAFKKRFESARGLAVKYRDECAAYKKANPPSQGAAGAAGTSSFSTSDADVEKLKKEVEAKTNEYTEASFRLNLLTSKVETMEEKQKNLLNTIEEKNKRIQQLENSLQSRTSDFSVTPVSSSRQTAPSSSKTLQAASQAEVESVNEEPEVSAVVDTVSPPDAGLNMETETLAPDATPSNIASSSLLSPTRQLFGRTGAVQSVGAFEEPSGAANDAEPSGGQNLVTASVSATETADDVQNDSESRDSNLNMPVSSTGGTRKRPAGSSNSQLEPKRQRETSNEAVSSSEEHMEIHAEPPRDDEAFIPDPIHPDQQNDEEEGEEDNDDDDDDDDVIPLDPPNQDNYGFDVDDEDVEEMQNMVDEEEDAEDSEDDEIQELDVPSSDEGDSEMDNHADDSEDSGDEESDEIQPPIGLNDEDDEDGEDSNDQNLAADQDVEVIGVDDNSRSQPILDDQDREAASAMEEADDEGRVSADGGIPNEAVQAPVPNIPRVRVPITFDDQCSSSNETGTVAQPSGRGMQTARRGGVRPTRAIFERGRGRGAPRGRGKN